MPLALAPQCCCGGPGFLRANGGHLFFNAAQDILAGKLKRWPCWWHPYDQSWNFFNEYDGAAGGQEPRARVVLDEGIYALEDPATGYNFHDDRLFWAGITIYADVEAVGTAGYGFTGLFAGKVGEDCAQWHDTTGVIGPPSRNGGGFIHCERILSQTELHEFYLSTIPSGYLFNEPTTNVILGQMMAGYSGVDSGRLWGCTRVWRYDEDDHSEGHLIGWSTALDATDYQEVFDRYRGDGDDVLLARSLNVCRGVLYSVDYITGLGHRLYANGSSLGEMTGLYGSTLMDFPAAKSGRSSQIILYGNGSAEFGTAFSTGKVYIFDDGSDGTTQELQFVLLDDDEQEMHFAAAGMAYDEEHDCVAIKWTLPLSVLYSLYPDGIFPWYALHTYCTYLMGSVTAGNLAEQLDKVLVYNQYPAAYGLQFGMFNGLGTYSPGRPYPNNWGYIISGRMPEVTKIVAGHAEGPPDPPPENPSCDLLADCDDENKRPASGGLQDLDNFDSDFFGDTVHWLWSRPGFGFTANFIGSGPGGYEYEKRFIETADLYNYANPGIFMGHLESTIDDEHDAEYYLTGMNIIVQCEDGHVKITQLTLWFQNFRDPTGAQVPIGEGNWVGNPDEAGSGLAETCGAGIMGARFKYQNFLVFGEGDGSRDFRVVLALGPVAGLAD